MSTSDLSILIATLESCATSDVNEADRLRRRADYLRCTAVALRDGHESSVFDILYDLEEFCWAEDCGSTISQALHDHQMELRAALDETS